jgi:DNA-binding NarL/FixJ family response regulator
LTERESDVLRLLVRGHSYASAGASLGMHVGTVQTHVKSIYRKLGVSSKTEAAWVAMSRGPGPGTRPP